MLASVLPSTQVHVAPHFGNPVTYRHEDAGLSAIVTTPSIRLIGARYDIMPFALARVQLSGEYDYSDQVRG